MSWLTKSAWRIAFGASIAVNLIGASFYARRWCATKDPSVAALNPMLYEFAVHRYANDPLRSGDVVALGDSFADAIANDLKGIADRGIPGETTIGLENRLDSTIEWRPQRVILWAGTNDLAAGRRPSDVAATLSRIIARLGNAGSEVTVVSILHLLPPATIDNHEVDTLDDQLGKVATASGATWLDVRAIADDPALRKADGEHLNPKGLLLLESRIFPKQP